MTSFEHIPLFYFLLPLVAFLYASVGHGGASGYLALMVLFAFPENELKSTALVLNICVSAIAFASYASKGFFNRKVFLYVGLVSIPAAFVGGTIDVEDQLLKTLLGIFLIIAALRIIGVFGSKKTTQERIEPNLYLALTIGITIGFLSGLLGIGGGILLTPLLIFLHWAHLKEAAGISALFILVNSTAGLVGQLSSQQFTVGEDIALLVTCAVTGGFVGSYLGSRKLNHFALRLLLTTVLLIACYKLFFPA